MTVTPRVVFVMDPLDRIDIEADSTFALMLEAQARGHEIAFAGISDLELQGGAPSALVRPLRVQKVSGAHYEAGASRRWMLQDAQAVFLRTDPPIGMDYVVATYILDRLDRSRTAVVNDPTGIRDCNEKLYALQWADLMPSTFVSSRPSEIRAFIEDTGDVVLKPLHFAGGAGIVRLVRGDKNTSAIVDLLTSEGQVAIMAQQYRAEVLEGDRRIILVDGAPMGVINRRPSPTDLRSNMHVGGVAEPAELTDRDRQICEALGPDLRKRGLLFVGIDVIGGFLTEINVTSPTGIQEIARFGGPRLDAAILDAVGL